MKIIMNNSVNIITELTLIELFYEFSIRLFPTLDEININNIQFSNIKNYIDRIMESISIARDNHTTAKIIQTRNANKSRHSDSIYKIEDMIMLNSRNIHRHIKKNDHSAKFYSRFLDSFKIIKMKSSISNYKLELLSKVDFISIHSNFHSNLLRLYISNDLEQFLKRESPRPDPVIPNDFEGVQYIVEKLLNHRSQRNPREYLV